jgi:hypothetical protein
MTAPVDQSALVNAAPPPRHRGQRSQEVLDALAQRDALISSAAEWFCAGMSARSAASTLHAALTRYHELGWRRDRDCSEVRGYPYKRSHLVALRQTKISRQRSAVHGRESGKHCFDLGIELRERGIPR